MRTTIPILKDKIQVLDTKSSYEVLIDIIDLYSKKFRFPSHPLPERSWALQMIKELRKDYEKELEELGKQPSRIFQKTLDQEIIDAKKDII